MKEYNPDICGVHHVKITLQRWSYTGHIFFEIHGNCHGLDIINSADFENDTFEKARTDCNLKYDEDYDMFSVELKDPDGEILELELDGIDMNQLIVAIEILELKEG